jgi:hypothetical protein
VEDELIVVTGTAKGILFMGESRVRTHTHTHTHTHSSFSPLPPHVKEAAGFFPMGNVSLLNGESARPEDEEEKLRKRSRTRSVKAERSEEGGKKSEEDETTTKKKEKEKEKVEGESTAEEKEKEKTVKWSEGGGDGAKDSESSKPGIPYISRAREIFLSLDQQEGSSPPSPGKEPKTPV